MANDVKWAVYVQAQAAARLSTRPNHAEHYSYYFRRKYRTFWFDPGGSGEAELCAVVHPSIVGLSSRSLRRECATCRRLQRGSGYGICREMESELPETEHQLRLQ